jgi:6,7-dimethyl-8-ribityllumazine synthase
LSSKDKNLSEFDLSKLPSAKDFKIDIAVSEWNTDITDALLQGSLDILKALGKSEEDISILKVPGSFELPVAAKMLLKKNNSDAVICLGCVIKGDTSHDEYINQAVANGLTQLSILSGRPVIFGVLTVNNKKQALERAGGKHGNKGVEAAVTAVTMVQLSKELNQQKKSIGF